MLNLKTAILIVSLLTMPVLVLAPSTDSLKRLFTHGAYPILLLLFICWIIRLVTVYGHRWRIGFRQHWFALLLSGSLVGLLFIVSPPKFKVLTDETNLIGVSMMMHEDKSAVLPIEGIYSEFSSPNYVTKVDKRPVFFPFLVSLLHSVIGYNPYNGFVLNFLAGWALLFMMYLVVSRVFTRAYGLLSIMMLASVPIFVVYVTASGFEVLNALLVVVAFYLLMETVEHRAENKITELLLLTLLLLAQCRYESVIFLPLFGLVLLPLLWREQFFQRMGYLTALSPLFFLPVFWQRLIFLDLPEVNKIDVGLFQKVDFPFSLQNLVQYLDDNIYVMLGIDPNWGFSALLSGLGIAGAYLICKNLIMKKDILLEKPVFWAGVITFGTLLGIISAFFWGKFTIPADNRLALVFLPYIIWMAVYCIYRICRQLKIQPNAALAVLAIFHLIYFWPYGALQRVSNAMALPYEYRVTLDYLNYTYQNRNGTLILAEHPNMYLIHQFSAFRISSVDKMLKTLPNETIERIVALQSFNLQSGEITAQSRLEGPLETSVVEQIMVTSFSGVKISECYFKVSADELNQHNVPPLLDREL